MTATPWGDSEELRDRMLVSGRVSPETAAQSQRERLFGAIVASCAERGYEATRISDLASLSGVSRRDFYRRFANKEACFLDALDALLAMGEGAAAGHYDGRGGGLEVLIKVCAAQPAAARFCLLESYVAGEPAVARMDAAVAEAAALFEAALRAIGGDSIMPREVVPAILGGIREVVQGRLREGRESELEALAPALRAWAFGYRAPPLPLPRPRPRAGSAGRYLPADPAERIIAAFGELVAERGYQATTIEEIVSQAGVSLSTFYERFDGKAAVLTAMLEAGHVRLAGVALPPYRRAKDWPSAVRAAFEAMFAFFAAEPAFARTALVEIFAAGAEALDLRARMIASMQAFLAPGFQQAPELDPIVGEAIGGATYALVFEGVRRGGAERLGSLAPLATYITLSPFIGAEEAAAAARGRR